MKDLMIGCFFVLVIVIIVGVASSWIGKVVKPTIEHHPLEYADCYVAYRSFYISISCVRRER